MFMNRELHYACRHFSKVACPDYQFINCSNVGL